MMSVVHLELHTPDLSGSADFLRDLFDWRAAVVPGLAHPYLTVDQPLSTGVVQCGTPAAVWIPYVEVEDVDETTARAVELGAVTTLAPRSGPYGRRSVLRSDAVGDLALWTFA